jgi:hypothetical protein
MAKKKKNKPKKQKAPQISKERQFLMTLIKHTENAIRNDGTDLDAFFKGQADKLKKQLEQMS